MMYATPPQAMWDHFLHEIFSMETLLYALGAVAFFLVIIIVLEFLDSTRGDDK